MPAPKGNKYWEARTTFGREKLFTSPDILWNAAVQYFEWAQQNPWERKDWVGKDGDEVTIETPRPLTLSGLCVFLDIGESTLRDYRDREEYSQVYTRIEQIIRTQKFEGAAVGTFNANIIARDLGLVDKQENKVEGNVNITGMQIK